MNQDIFLHDIRAKARQRMLYLPHAIDRMSKPDQMISATEVRYVINAGSIIEDYPEDARGHSCLMLGYRNDTEPIHVVCAPKDEYLAIITVYIPEPDRWKNGFSKRIKP